MNWRTKGITIVLIAVREDFDRVRPLLKELKVDKPIVLTDREGKVTEQYQVRYPADHLLYRSGRQGKGHDLRRDHDQAEVTKKRGRASNEAIDGIS